MINRIWNEILDRVYPPDLYCISCGKIIDDTRPYRLCDDCREIIRWTTGRCCRKCGKPLTDNNPTDTCFSCREHEHEYDRGFSCAEYGAHERAIIFNLKYNDKLHIAQSVGRMMADRMLAEFSADELAVRYDTLVPVPLTKEKRLKRGYNQSSLICRWLSEYTGIPYDRKSHHGELLERTKETAAMKGLSPDERRANVRGSFAVIDSCAHKLKDASCLIVDDIYTTGATVDEISRVLHAAGASRIDVLTFAAGADVVKA